MRCSEDVRTEAGAKRIHSYLTTQKSLGATPELPPVCRFLLFFPVWKDMKRRIVSPMGATQVCFFWLIFECVFTVFR